MGRKFLTQRRKESKDAKKNSKLLCVFAFFAPLREPFFVMLVYGQRAVGVITAWCEWRTIVSKVKLSFGLR